mmetsp:Transcript_53768/g.149188  ORF Transcript_53768/g.149188 Transcript_53768/m.149188 type:complete len:425 (+) Transcript_53768:148-1422(+)
MRSPKRSPLPPVAIEAGAGWPRGPANTSGSRASKADFAVAGPAPAGTAREQSACELTGYPAPPAWVELLAGWPPFGHGCEAPAASPKLRPSGSIAAGSDGSAPVPVRGWAMPAATAAGSGCFSHLDVSKESCAGSSVLSTGLEKSVGTAGVSSSRLRRSATAALFGFGAVSLASFISTRSSSRSGVFWCAASLPLGQPFAPLLVLLLALAPPLGLSSSSPSSGLPGGDPSFCLSCSCLSLSLSCWALRIAFNFCTRFTVVGIRTPSETCFCLCTSSCWPSISQSSAACVSLRCSRKALLAGPSSKPWESSEERDNGSTGRVGPASASPGSSFAFLSISLAEKSAIGTSAPVAATALPHSSLSWSSISTCASRCSGVISTIGRNSMRVGSDVEMACAEVAKNSYSKYFKVCNVESRMSPRYSSRM